MEPTYYQVETSMTVGNLFAALVAVQPRLVLPGKDTVNTFFKAKYAPLDACIEANREILGTHGLAVIQPPTGTGTNVVVTTILIHKSGEYIKSSYGAQAKASDPQAVGSGITYLRRYGYLAILGIAPRDEDDDGDAASKPSQPSQVQIDIRERLTAFAGFGVTEKMITEKMGKQLASLTSREWEELRSIYGSIAKGEKKVSECFPANAADQINAKMGAKKQ
jgi:hypothetical protein